MFGKESLRGAIYIYPGDVEESEASTGTNVVRDRETSLCIPKGQFRFYRRLHHHRAIHTTYIHKNIHGDIIHQEYRNI